MTPTPWAMMKTLPPGSGSGPDLREHLDDSRETDVDCLARLQAGPFPCDRARRWDVEAYQEALDAVNYCTAGLHTCEREDGYDWSVVWIKAHELARLLAQLCRRRDEKEAGR